MRFKELAESVAKRPAMYVGSLKSKGLYQFIREVLSCIVFVYRKAAPFFTIEYEGNKSYCITVKNAPFTSELADGLFVLDDWRFIYIRILFAMSSNSRLRLRSNEATYEWIFQKGTLVGSDNFILESDAALELRFSFDDTFFKQDIDYYELNEMCLELAMLARQASFLLKGNTSPILSQNFLHFPDGLGHKLNKLSSESNRVAPIVFIDEYFSGNYYQIGVAFQEDGFWDIGKVSYGGYRQMIEGGSLQDGIVAGVMDIRKKYRSNHACDRDHYHSRRHFVARLIIVAQVLTESGKYDTAGQQRTNWICLE